MYFTRLFYFAENQKFKLDVFTQAFNAALYYCVLEIPEVEMISKSLAQMGEEVLLMTASAHWLTLKRKATYGDILQYRNNYYGYIMNSDTNTSVALERYFNLKIYQLPHIQPLALVQIREREKVYG